LAGYHVVFKAAFIQKAQRYDELCCCKTEYYGKSGADVGQEFMMKLGFIKFGAERGLSWMAW
jgi:hypothetical protein